MPPDHHGGVLGGGQQLLRALRGGDGQVGWGRVGVGTKVEEDRRRKERASE